MKIRTAIFVVYVAASAVGFAVLMRFILAEVRPRYVAAVRLSMQDTARLLASALAGRTPAQAAEVLGGPAGFRRRVLGPDGKTLFDSHEASAPAPYNTATRSLGARLLDEAPDRDDLDIAVTAPVRLAGDTAAQLVLSRSFRSVDAVIWAERRKLAAVAMLIAAVMVVAGWWIAAKLTDSLERLTVYAQSVRDGRPVRPPLSRAVEIAALAQAFEEMRDALEGRKHAERYTQALAHEVKAPLAAIRGAAELLDEAMPEEERRKFLANIRTESARIQQIIERLLELSSLEARKALQQTAPVEVTELLNEAAAVLAPACAAIGVTLRVQGVAATIRGERVLLREALVNLLQNAQEFSPAGGEVWIRAEAAGGRVTITVDDNGAGVPEFALPRVFERFYSLPRPGGTRKSTGLGLALAREIAHLHGGDVTLANRPEGGARAALTLPL
ncbi:MAG TPA: ATP-binding protein [Lacunisphaera sp.]|nr:ATP-binding protein [Lacunisphaera sp.]